MAAGFVLAFRFLTIVLGVSKVIYPPTHPINRAYELILQKAVNRPRVPIDVHWAFIDKAIAKAKVHILKVCGLHYYYYYYYYYYY